MNTDGDGKRAARLRRRLADEIAQKGDLRTSEWRRAVEVVPREMFLGERIYRRIDDPRGTVWESVPRADDDQWLDLAYRNETWVTQLDATDDATQGAPTSSSTLPGLVVRMLEDLQVNDDSIEVDAHVAVRARAALHRAGHDPTLVIGDGLVGHPADAPYDRLIATCSVRNIPARWLAQVRPGGLSPAGCTAPPWSVLPSPARGRPRGRFFQEPFRSCRPGHMPRQRSMTCRL
jgi:protein-L-isoaspartate O-methyltransferase